MPRVQAWERLNDASYSGALSMTGFYELLLAAGYDRDTAEQLANERGWQRLDAGVEM